ncbi:MAG: pantetheine-phosphate adenylyltransferase [Candidatus Bathyarchaeota archaeon]|jgi:pantetheine-phosphate adenylyltransferase
MKRKFKTVAVGGTFDNFHKGHKTLILKAFEIGKKVLIGLSSDKLVEKLEKPHPTSSYKLRLAQLKMFLQKHNLLGKSSIIPLNDVYGITLSKDNLDAIIVSRETEAMAIKINEERKKLGLSKIHVEVVDMVKSENNIPISTTRIHEGEIDRQGHVLK